MDLQTDLIRIQPSLQLPLIRAASNGTAVACAINVIRRKFEDRHQLSHQWRLRLSKRDSSASDRTSNEFAGLVELYRQTLPCWSNTDLNVLLASAHLSETILQTEPLVVEEVVDELVPKLHSILSQQSRFLRQVRLGPIVRTVDDGIELRLTIWNLIEGMMPIIQERDEKTELAQCAKNNTIDLTEAAAIDWVTLLGVGLNDSSMEVRIRVHTLLPKCLNSFDLTDSRWSQLIDAVIASMRTAFAPSDAATSSMRDDLLTLDELRRTVEQGAVDILAIMKQIDSANWRSTSDGWKEKKKEFQQFLLQHHQRQQQQTQ